MSRCPTCSAVTAPDARFCGRCGHSLEDPSQFETTYRAPASPTPPHSGSSPGRADDPGFAPGQVLLERYRIVAPLGRGGMGDVYRADDLKLGQPVALKFLPRRFGDDPARLERFHAEVRHARQVSHPHVCRVYDIGEFEGQLFLSMEYVDGEDLATLLRRIGRLPQGKGVEIARQVCAGLAAAHDRGVLHRDLKPSNVMIDGHGRARITDFGLAVREDEAAGGESAGTPAYMAPERLAGRPATVQSDLYALGLVLYEVFTGHRAFEATTLAGWRSAHSTALPTQPSTHIAALDPAVERVILRCLEKDEAARPRSATQVALALPGGDPLAAAIAAGETPSPEMVAAAGGEGTLRPGAAWGLLAATVLAVLACAWLAGHATLLGIERTLKPPEAIRERALEMVGKLGYGENAADVALWVLPDNLMLINYVRENPSPARVERLPTLQPNPLQHFFRISPRLLVPQREDGRVDWRDPPEYYFGEVKASFGPTGLVQAFRAIAPPAAEPGAAAPESAWDTLFEYAGLRRGDFREVPASITPFNGADRTYTWEGSPDGVRLRIEGASLGGRVTQFNVTGPHDWDHRQVEDLVTPSARVVFGLMAALTTLALVGVMVFARRNLRLGRGDTRGALRVASFVGITAALSWLFGADHVLEPGAEQRLFLNGLGQAVVAALAVFAGYLAIEPTLRRRWPGLLVAWTRLLAGDWRDPLVGRSVLAGFLGGSLAALLLLAAYALPSIRPVDGLVPLPDSATVTSSARYYVSRLLGQAVFPALIGLGATVVVALGLTLFRRRWAAAAALFVMAALGNYFGLNPWIDVPLSLAIAAIAVFVYVRFGLLAFVAMLMAQAVLIFMPLGLDPGRWWAPYGYASIVAVLVPAAIGFRVALGRQPVLGGIDG
jgi:serine/threonine-protein kinase